MNINCFRNQITVILGRDGAGKSTFLKMLMGMIAPTAGTAYINGYDIQKRTEKARRVIGICPQNSILFDEFTVREHIEFFCRLKGLTGKDVDKEVKKYVRVMNLESKIDTISSELSDGDKRKLSFALALCGDSKVIICNESTSGMDPASRREVWSALKKLKKGRTIILTTHSMDEADVLGDRIYIMANGKVLCGGSSSFLKNKLGKGYHLTCVKAENFDSDELTEKVRRTIPDAEIYEDKTNEIVYMLPLTSIRNFGTLFEKLEKQQDDLKVKTFGLTSTEMDEIFRTLQMTEKKPPATKDESESSESETSESDSDVKSPDDEKVSGENGSGENGSGEKGPGEKCSEDECLEELCHCECGCDCHKNVGFAIIDNRCCLCLNHWFAMFLKRLYLWSYNWYILVLQVLIIILAIVIAFAFSRLDYNYEYINLPLLNISLEQYRRTITLIKEFPESYNLNSM